MGNYYNGSIGFPYLEKAILLEDVPLPVYNKKSKLKRKFFYAIQRLLYHEPDSPDVYDDNFYDYEMDKEFKLAYNEMKNIEANFCIPILTPTLGKSDNQNERKTAPSKTGFKGDHIESKSYTYSNSVKLTIPKYILFQFLDNKTEIEKVKDPFIPKGTEFIICAIGGIGRMENIRIIGLFTLEYDSKKFPSLTDDYYGGNKKT